VRYLIFLQKLLDIRMSEFTFEMRCVYDCAKRQYEPLSGALPAPATDPGNAE
jgi:hypothetical protein